MKTGGAAILFSSDLPIPRTADRTGIPTSWISDTEVFLDAKGLLFDLASRLAPGTVVTGAATTVAPHPSDPPIADLIGQLVATGYLIQPDPGEPRYVLVHPDRLPPLPPAEGVAP